MRNRLVIIAWASIFPLLAQAGVASSGGGVSVVCRDNGNIVSAELYDLYEAKHLHDKTLWDSSGNAADDYVFAVKNMQRIQNAPSRKEGASREDYEKFIAAAMFLDEPLDTLPDMGRKLELPLGCSYEQLAIAGDDIDAYTINKQIWDHLNAQNKSALVMHELVYRWDRADGRSTSESSRDTVALVYAKNGTTVSDGLPFLYKQFAATDPRQGLTKFYTFPWKEAGEERGVTLQFTHIFGYSLMEKVSINIPIKWDLRLRDPVTGRHVSTPYTHSSPVVWEQGADQNFTVKLPRIQMNSYELQIVYQYRKLVQFNLLENGQTIAHDVVARGEANGNFSKEANCPMRLDRMKGFALGLSLQSKGIIREMQSSFHDIAEAAKKLDKASEKYAIMTDTLDARSESDRQKAHFALLELKHIFAKLQEFATQNNDPEEIWGQIDQIKIGLYMIGSELYQCNMD